MRTRVTGLFLVMLSASGFAHPLDEVDVTKPLDAKLLKPFDLAELRFLRNTIHARHGRKFDSASLTTFFSSREWYFADPMYSDSRLTAVEKANVDLIARTEKARGGAWTEAQYVDWIASTLAGLIPEGSVGLTQSDKWEVPIACGVPETRVSTSGTAIAETGLEGGEVLFTFAVLLRNGPGSWLGIDAADPKKEINVERDGKRALVNGRFYGSPAGLRQRQTLSAEDCRKTGHY